MPNTRAMILMTAAMAAFAVCDAFIKLASQRLGIGQIVMLFSFGAFVLFVSVMRTRGEPLFTRGILHHGVLIRTFGEAAGTLGLMLALANVPLSLASALLQAQPLAATMAAALILREAVGIRRWMAIATGFVGVLVILRPGLAGFDPNALWGVLAVLGLSLRDVGTRMLPSEISSAFVNAWALLAVALIGAVMMLTGPGWEALDSDLVLLHVGMIVSVSLALIAIVGALRAGEISAVAPFRYTRMVFALILAFLVFGEVPDWATWSGTALVIASGLYAYLRERRLARPAAR